MKETVNLQDRTALPGKAQSGNKAARRSTKTHEIKKSSAMLLRPTHLTAAPCCAAGIGIMVVDGLPGFDVKCR